MKMIRDNLQLILVIYDPEFWDWQLAIDGECRGTVFEFPVFGPFVAKETICEDCEAVVGTSGAC